MNGRKELTNGKYVDDQMGNGIPEGGTTGQVLKKNSNDDYDVVWGTGGGGGGSAVWGGIIGTVTDQTDLTSYISGLYTPLTRTLSINGVSYDLSANRSWTIDSLPSQSGNTGKWLKTNGSIASWQNLSGNISLFTNDTGYLTSSTAGSLYYPLSSNPSNYLTSTSAGLLYYPLSSNPASYLTTTLAASTYEPTITAGTTGQYWRGDKTWQNFPTIPAAQIQSDWNQSNNTALDYIKNKPTIPTVGTWGALNYPTWTTGTPFVKMTAAGTFSLDTNTYLTGITSSDVTTALGYTPYNGTTNPNGYITSSALSPYLTSSTAASTYTPLTRTITINSTSYDLSANRTWNVGDLLSSGSYSNPTWLTSLAWSKISGTPTSLSGYGITDSVVLTTNSYSNPSWLTSLAWTKISGAPSFLTSAITSLNSLTGSTQTFANDTNVTITSAGTTHTLGWTGTLADSRIASASTWNGKQDAITLTTTGTSGPATFIGNTLNIPQYSGGGGGGTPASPTGSVQFNDSGSFGGDSNLTWDNVNKYLGIGTATPTVKLDVKGNTKIISDGVFTIGASYKGGVIAYILQPGDSGYDPEYIRGFIATASDLSTGIQWYNGTYIVTGTNDPSIGIGESNTYTIVNYQGSTYADYAAGLALDDSTNGYTDWYLPSKDELNKLYLNRVAIGGFSSDVYWSSTESTIPFDGTDAWTQDFSTGTQIEDDKSQAHRVRAIRNFSVIKTKFNLLDSAIGLHSRIGIGIGTDNPQAPLDIAGDAGATGGGGGPRFLLYGTNGTPQYLSGLGVDLGQAGSSFGFFAGNQAAFTVEQATVFENFPYPSGYTTRFAIIPGGNIGIGTVTPIAKLHVYNDSGPLVANFQAQTGDPLQILCANTLMSVGYPATQGSIGNGGGVLSVKIGVNDTDWAPIVYEGGPMPEKTITAINLSTTGPYIMTSPGIYEVINATVNIMYFPDPTTLVGQKITIVNTDLLNNITLDNPYAPFARGDNSQMFTIPAGQMWQFLSIGGVWRGMRG